MAFFNTKKNHILSINKKEENKEMDGILLADGTFVAKDAPYHIDMIKGIFTDCKSEQEAIKRHKCVIVVESRDIHTGIHYMKDDFIVFDGDDLTKEQLSYLREHIDELTLSQIKQIPELAQMKGLHYYEKCNNCFSYSIRANFINGNHMFSDREDKVNYFKGNLRPDDYCECCRKCNEEEM